jgi:hypothetical protein
MYWQSIIRRGLKRLWSGVPTTFITQPFDRAQATRTLNAVFARGTFEEMNAVFLALGELGYTAYPSSGDPSSWQIVPIEPSRIEEQAYVLVEKPTLGDIEALAAELVFDVRGGGEHDKTFDLDKRSDRSLGGTWRNDQVGITDAYGYLVRYQLTLEKSDQARGHL